MMGLMIMSLDQFLIKQKGSILGRWLDRLFDVYPEGSHGFLKKAKGRFSNPVGYTLSKELEILYGEISKEGISEKALTCLDNILRIRAVQDLKPSEALSFIFDLKAIVRDELNKKKPGNGAQLELAGFEKKIDEIGLEAFDIYSRCRQKIYDLRVKEIKRQVSRLMERANLVCEIPEIAEDL